MPTDSPAGPPRVSAAPELRRKLLAMVLAIVVLDAAVLFLKSRLLVDAWPEQRRLLFTGAWMLATLAVLIPFLTRMRAARLRARQARATGRGR